jgi:hypothetical protein
MEKIITLIAIIILSVQISFSQTKVNGGYRSCSVNLYSFKFGELDLESKENPTFYEYDVNGNQIKYSMCTDNKGLCWGTYYKYDIKNNLIEKKSYSAYGVIYDKSTFKYDEKNILIEESFFEDGVSITRKETYKYDSKGNKIEKIIYKNDGSLQAKHVFKNDAYGKIIEDLTYNLDGTINFKVTYKNKYNEKGELIEISECYYKEIYHKIYECKYDLKGVKIEDKTFYNDKPENITTYNSQGLVTENIDYFEDGTINFHWFNKYDVYGNVIEILEYDKLNEPKRKFVNVYSK